MDTALPYEARRSGPRATVPFPVTVRPVGSYVTEPARIRDLSAKGITRQSSANTLARQANAAAGGPLMAPDELDDPIEL